MPGVGYDWTGLAREEVNAGALGILVVYLVLAAQYESYSDPLIILMTVPQAPLTPIAAWRATAARCAGSATERIGR